MGKHSSEHDELDYIKFASMVDALALNGDALAAFRKGWHEADNRNDKGSRVAAGLLNIADWLREKQPEGKHSKSFDELITEYSDARTDTVLGEVIDRRVEVYGDPVIGHQEIAQMWSTYLGFEVEAYQVPIMMMLMKVVRSKTSPDYSDHIDDIKGYADIFEKVMGEDLIHARSVNEFIEIKWPKA